MVYQLPIQISNLSTERKDERTMQKLEQLYEGKAKKVFRTDDPELYIVDYKDDATACSACSTRTQTEYWALDTRSTVPSASRWAAYSVCWESVSE